MIMPKMIDHLVVTLQQQSLTIDRALEADRLFLIDRQRLVDYRKSIFRQFEDNQSILLS
jgi:hypothetical protein